MQHGYEIGILFFLREDQVTRIAVVADLFTIGGSHPAIVAAGTSIGLLMANVVRVGIPPDVHLREYVHAVDVAERLGSLVDCVGFSGSNVRIIFRVISMQLFTNRFTSRFVAVERLLDDAYGLELDER